MERRGRIVVNMCFAVVKGLRRISSCNNCDNHLLLAIVDLDLVYFLFAGFLTLVLLLFLSTHLVVVSSSQFSLCSINWLCFICWLEDIWLEPRFPRESSKSAFSTPFGCQITFINKYILFTTTTYLGWNFQTLKINFKSCIFI